MKKIISAIMVALMMVVTMGMFTACSMGQPLDVAVTIDGYDLTIGSSVADLLDAGFDIAETAHPDSIIFDSSYEEIPAKSVQAVGSYYIIKDGKASNVAIKLVNKSTEAKLVSDCTIYSIKVDGEFFDALEYLDVEINGVDIKTASLEDVINTLTDSGCKYDSDEVDGMLSTDAYATSVTSYKTGNYIYMVTRDFSLATNEVSFGEFEMYESIDTEY